MGVDQRSGNLHLVIAKMIDNKRRTIHVEIVDELTNSDRGKKGFGSTGK